MRSILLSKCVHVVIYMTSAGSLQPGRHDCRHVFKNSVPVSEALGFGLSMFEWPAWPSHVRAVLLSPGETGRWTTHSD